MKKLSFLIIILTVGIPFSCDESRTSLNGTYEIESLILKAGKISEETFGYQFEEIIFDPADTDTLSASLFGMSIWIDELKYVPNENASLFDFNFINGAFADTVLPSPESKITSISVYSSEPIQADGTVYQAGDNLALLFKASGYYGETMIIDDFIIHNEEWNQYEPIYLHFEASLDTPLAQTFQVKITMDDENVFNLQVPQVILK